MNQRHERESLRQSMAWLHTWSGLVVGWILFIVFTTGTISYYQEEISQWMRPELYQQAVPEVAIEQATVFLEEEAYDAQRWHIRLPTSRVPFTRLIWFSKPKNGGGSNNTVLDGTGKPVLIRDTNGGLSLYWLHYELHYIWYLTGRWIIGAASMAMLVAILSGVITHKKIFTDFFTLRLRKGQRSWLDGHNILSVLALPFHLMITFTGLITLMFLYNPWGITAAYDSENNFYDEAYVRHYVTSPSGNSAPLISLAPLLDQAQRIWNEGQAAYLDVYNPGDENAIVEIRSSSENGIATGERLLVFDGITGSVKAELNPPGLANLVRIGAIGLHAGRYASSWLRRLYFFSGLTGTAMVATGLVLWSIKRKSKLKVRGKTHFGIAFVDVLNLGTIIGLPIGIAAFFWANRLLPVSMEGRAEWEVHVMFAAWALCFLPVIWRPLHRAWIELCWLAAGAYGLIPLLNFLSTERHLGVSIPANDWVLAGFDLSAFTTGLFFAWLGWILLKRSRLKPLLRKTQSKSRAELHSKKKSEDTASVF